MEYLYHGSTTQGLTILEPRKRFTPSGELDFSAIYASPHIAFAICHAFLWTSNEGVDIDVQNGQFILLVPKELQDRLKVPISTYKVSATGFEETKEEQTGYTWHTVLPVNVLEETRYVGVQEALEHAGGLVKIID